jgi:hypothetical protein
MVALRKTASRQIVLELEKLTRHCKGQHYPKMRFPENPLGMGFGTQVERWKVRWKTVVRMRGPGDDPELSVEGPLWDLWSVLALYVEGHHFNWRVLR